MRKCPRPPGCTRLSRNGARWSARSSTTRLDASRGLLATQAPQPVAPLPCAPVGMSGPTSQQIRPFFCGACRGLQPSKASQPLFYKARCPPGAATQRRPAVRRQGKAAAFCLWMCVAVCLSMEASISLTPPHPIREAGFGAGRRPWCMRTSPPPVRAARGCGGGGAVAGPRCVRLAIGRRSPLIPEIGKLLANR
jgi:hypothetical protein